MNHRSGWLWRWLPRIAISELFRMLGVLGLGRFALNRSVRINPFNLAAWIALARREPTRSDSRRRAVDGLFAAIDNREGASASDLAVLTHGHRRLRRLAARLLWDRGANPELELAHDAWLQRATAELIHEELEGFEAGDGQRRRALTRWAESLGHPHPEASFSLAVEELSVDRAAARQRIETLIDGESYPDPSTPARWTLALREAGELDLAQRTDDFDHSFKPTNTAPPLDETGPPRLLLTEDHEIHEERGFLPLAVIRDSLIDRSKTAATLANELGFAWTHMVEIGSTLKIPAAGAARFAAWAELESAIHAHLRDELARGNDLQLHLHAFNDPEHPSFPYEIHADGLRMNKKFLLTHAQARGAFAEALKPSERLEAIRDARETLLRVVPNADPRLFRSGALETGVDAGDRAWTGAAVLAAGLVGLSDQIYGENELTIDLDGLLQLPIHGNSEGDFWSSPGRLKRSARRALKRGRWLTTLLTHDKFLGSRGQYRVEAENLDDDLELLRQHLAEYKRLGARSTTFSKLVASG